MTGRQISLKICGTLVKSTKTQSGLSRIINQL